MKNLSIAFVLVVGSVAGCAEPQVGEVDESVTETSSALTTGKFTLHNYQTGLCLGVAAGTPKWGTPLITWYCDNSANQTWSQYRKRSGEPGAVEMKNYVGSNLCMHTNSSTNGSPAEIFLCETSDSQEIVGWKPIYSGNDLKGHECYRFLKEGTTTQVLGVAAGNPNPGTQTIMWTDYNNAYRHPDQFWCIY